MEQAHEYMKYKDRSNLSIDIAINALQNDPENYKKVYIAENTHKRIKDKIKHTKLGQKYY